MVYNSFLPIAEHLFITYVWSDLAGDTCFPYWNRDEWDETWIERKWRKNVKDDLFTRFAEYRLKQKPPPADAQINWHLPETNTNPARSRGVFSLPKIKFT